MARDGDITVQDFLEERLTGCRLAVLSACETAVFGGQLPDEVVSLPTGLLQAGVAGVVGSLWPVSDAATRALMTRFYELWRGDGLEPAEALRHAQRWLRDGETTDSVAGPHDYWHPEHWAGFTYVGV